ncbi:MAG: WGR domain-containing protein [Gemmatimonadales bacterium]
MIRRWENPDLGRYYVAVVTDDLFGGWNLSRFWGGCDSRRGGQLQQHFDDAESIEEQLRRIALRRRQRDYSGPDPA